MEEERKRENIAAGSVGAFLGSLLGVACIVILGQMGYVAALSGVVMAVCSLKGYEKLGGCLSKKGAVISCALILVMTWFANRLDWAVMLARALDAGIPESFAAVGPLLEEGLIEGTAYWGNLVMLYLFTLLGAVPTVINGLRGNRQIAPAQGPGGSSEGEAALAEQYEFYPAQKGWLLLPRLSILFLMFFPLAVAIVLLSVAIGRENDWNWLLAAMGALAASFVCIFAALPTSKMLRADNLLMVRAPDRTLWQVRLDLLNSVASYRFTTKSGLWTGMKWHRLSEEEQRAAEESVARAIEDLGRDPSYRGLMAVPLTDLSVIKENRWKWKVTYQARGRMKSKTIAKAYPGLCPEPGAGTAQERFGFRWDLCAASVGCTLVLTAVGWASGGFATGGGVPSERAKPAEAAVAAIPESTARHALDGVTYEVDGAWQNEGGPDRYLDPATGAAFFVSVVHGADEETAVSRLTQPISEFRMNKDFKGFRFDRVDPDSSSNLAVLTAQNGETYQYNILSVHFLSGMACHVAVALAEDGTMVVAEAVHESPGDEAAVKSSLLFVLQSVAVTGDGDAAGGVQITEENYQDLFSPAVQLGYEQVGVAYIKAPEGMFGRAAFLDAYLPYGPELEYREDGRKVQSTAHGMSVSVSMAEAKDAKAAVEQAFAEFAASGADLYEDGVYESQYLGDLDIAYKQILFFENNRTLPRIAFLYADVKQEGYYLCAQITYLPEQMDEEYPALLEELRDVFALDLPQLDPMN